MAARELRNVSGEARALQDSSGVWHVVEDGGVYSVDAADERYYQTGECGEPPIWEDVAPAKASKSKTKDEE